MTTVGRWSPNKVRARVLDGTWVSTEELGGMVLLTPTSIAYTGTSASIGTNGSVEFTASLSLSLNGVFSADYDNYIIAQSGYGSSNTNTRYMLRTTTDENGSNYTRQFLQANGSTVAGNRATETNALLGGFNSALGNGTVVYVYGPFLAQPTAFRSNVVASNSGALLQDCATTHSLPNSYTGITLFGDPTAYLTGSISVYGLVGA